MAVLTAFDKALCKDLLKFSNFQLKKFGYYKMGYRL